MNIKINLRINFKGRRRNFNVAMYILSKMKFERDNDAKKWVYVVSFGVFAYYVILRLLLDYFSTLFLKIFFDCLTIDCS